MGRAEHMNAVRLSKATSPFPFLYVRMFTFSAAKKYQAATLFVGFEMERFGKGATFHI